jgi:hypothetical protein
MRCPFVLYGVLQTALPTGSAAGNIGFDRANFNTPSNNIASGNDPMTGRPVFGTVTSLLPNINAPSRQAEFAVRFQF